MCDGYRRDVEEYRLYPGYIHMQYMARYANNVGIYIASHDTKGLPKVFSPYILDGNIRLDIRPFPCVEPGTSWERMWSFSWVSCWMSATESPSTLTV